MKQTRLANKATDAFIALHARCPNPQVDTDTRWLAGWKRGYRLGRLDQKRSTLGKPE